MQAISSVVEGDLDEAVALRLLGHSGADPSFVYGKKGKPYVLKRIANYNQAARHKSFFVLVDLDNDLSACELRQAWLPNCEPRMCFRIAVRAIEAWLIADRDGLSRFLRIARSRIPDHPDMEADPKQTMVNLARKSRSVPLRNEFVPSERGGRRVGPGYVTRLIEFVNDTDEGWSVEAAMNHSDSLTRCVAALRAMVAGEAGS